MSVARLMTAWMPVEPTTAAIAPNAPIGAVHMIIERMRKTRIWMLRMPLSTGSPALPSACRAKPTSRATKSVWRMLPAVSEDSSEVGMIPSRKSVVPLDSVSPASYCVPLMSRPAPGWMMLPTMRPIARAKVDMAMK